VRIIGDGSGGFEMAVQGARMNCRRRVVRLPWLFSCRVILEVPEMRQSVVAVFLAVILVTGVASPAAATTANISPSAQTHAHGVVSHWTVSWSGHSPFTWIFTAGDGQAWGQNGDTHTSVYISYTFYPCSTTRYAQALSVWDAWNIGGGASSYATEYGGNPC